jgi:hypothetical protein
MQLKAVKLEHLLYFVTLEQGSMCSFLSAIQTGKLNAAPVPDRQSRHGGDS